MNRVLFRLLPGGLDREVVCPKLRTRLTNEFQIEGYCNLSENLSRKFVANQAKQAPMVRS